MDSFGKIGLYKRFEGTLLDNRFSNDIFPIIQAYLDKYHSGLKLIYLKQLAIKQTDAKDIINKMNTPAELRKFMRWRCDCYAYEPCSYCDANNDANEWAYDIIRWDLLEF